MTSTLFAISMLFSFLATCFGRPHILLVVADDLGWNDIGYHNEEEVTPNLDKLSEEGIRLNNYYVQQICTPSRSQLLTGKYQIHTGLQHNLIRHAQPNGVPLAILTLADLLKLANYRTHIVGKWHLGYYRKEYLPTYRGFDSFYGYLNGCEDYYSRETCDSFYVQEKKVMLCGHDLFDNDKPANLSAIYSTEMFTQKAQAIIAAHSKQHSEQEVNTRNCIVKQPLFLYLPYQAVHYPEQVPQRYVDKFSHIKDPKRRTFFGMLSCLDEAVGNVTSTLQQHGMLNNTVIVFTTDNGGKVECGSNNWPLRGSKATLWEGGVRGVGFVSSALLRQRGVSHELIHISDWLPTLAHLAGVSTTGLELDGVDVWSTISEGSKSPRTELLHNIDPLTPLRGNIMPGSPFDNRVMAAVRVGQWKLITGNPGNDSWTPPPEKWNTVAVGSQRMDACSCTEGSPVSSVSGNSKNVWLYDVVADPSESHDLSADLPDLVMYLLHKLAYYNSTAVPVSYPPMDLQADPALHGGYWVPWVH